MNGATKGPERHHTHVAQLARDLPDALDREEALLPALKRLGVSDAELDVLRADEHLLRILAEEARDTTDEAARQELERVMKWHAKRLARVAGESLHPSR
ncbi:MAG: hypothetical protein JNK82_24825 [Myxococcaceae bacterium]|nr:hypothetical protein [Myxococcaceae bacterium]